MMFRHFAALVEHRPVCTRPLRMGGGGEPSSVEITLDVESTRLLSDLDKIKGNRAAAWL